jgi:hypothetical protein
VHNVSFGSYFFNKEYILISRQYQLHPASATMQCPSGNTDAHNKKEEKELQKKNKSLATVINFL